jgi:hypothetical protein
MEAARRSFDGTELLKRADLGRSKRNSAVAALPVVLLAQQPAVGKPTIGSYSGSNLTLGTRSGGRRGVDSVFRRAAHVSCHWRSRASAGCPSRARLPFEHIIPNGGVLNTDERRLLRFTQYPLALETVPSDRKCTFPNSWVTDDNELCATPP